MPDAWRAYLEMALGLTEAPRKRAQKVVGDVVNRGGATAAQLQGLVDDLLSAGMANREALTNIVRYEVDKALGVVGLATAEEVTELTTRVRDLERQLREAESRAQTGIAADAPSEGVGGTRIDEPAPRPRAAKKAVAKAVPNAMPSAGTTPSQPPANTPREAPAKKAVAAPSANPPQAAPAKKAVAGPPSNSPQAAPAKKAVAKKTVAKKAVPPPDEVIPADQKATAKIAPATAQAEAQGARPAKKTAAKKAPAKKAAKKAVAKATPPPPAGTADSPNAAVRDAAAATELPPATEA
jgi:polyhydroxyalkanoate synthesis regulator phasin